MTKKKKILWAIGTMSGTSFDGVDAAIVKTDGRNLIKFIDATFIPYTRKERALYGASFFKNYNLSQNNLILYC